MMRVTCKSIRDLSNSNEVLSIEISEQIKRFLMINYGFVQIGPTHKSCVALTELKLLLRSVKSSLIHITRSKIELLQAKIVQCIIIATNNNSHFHITSISIK